MFLQQPARFHLVNRNSVLFGGHLGVLFGVSVRRRVVEVDDLIPTVLGLFHRWFHGSLSIGQFHQIRPSAPPPSEKQLFDRPGDRHQNQPQNAGGSAAHEEHLRRVAVVFMVQLDSSASAFISAERQPAAFPAIKFTRSGQNLEDSVR